MSKFIFSLIKEQEDYEDCLLMDASYEDIKKNKEAKKAFKFISKRKRYVNFIQFLDRKGIL